MKNLWFKIIVGAVIIVASEHTTRAVNFEGEILGVWTNNEGIEDVVSVGESFLWPYTLQSIGTDSSHFFGVTTSAFPQQLDFAGNAQFIDGIPGVNRLLEISNQIGVTLGNFGRVEDAFAIVDFSDPRDGSDQRLEVFVSGPQSPFFASGEFLGFGEGRVIWSNPRTVSVPDQTSTFTCLFLSLACIAASSIFLKHRAAVC